MFCTKCGNELISNQKFCTNCGNLNSQNSPLSSEQKIESNIAIDEYITEVSDLNTSSQTKLNTKATSKRRFNKVFRFILFIILMGSGVLIAFDYWGKSKFEQAVTSFENGQFFEAANFSLTAILEHQTGKFELSREEYDELIYIQSISDSLKTRPILFRSYLNQIPKISAGELYAFLKDAGHSLNNNLPSENLYGFDLRKILSEVVNSYDSLLVFSIDKFVSENSVIYSNSNKPYVNVGPENSIDIDSMYSLIRYPYETPMQKLISSIKFKLPPPPTKTALFFSNLHRADSAFKVSNDSLAKLLYETALIYKPGDIIILKQLAIVNNRLSRGQTPSSTVKHTESKQPTILPKEEPKDLHISFHERNSISWTNLGTGWEYAVTIIEKDAGDVEVYFINSESSRLSLPINNLIDNRLYVIKIESINDNTLGPVKSKSFSLVENGTKIDPTCK